MSALLPPAGPILVVEDHPPVREILVDLLSGEGYAVDSAANGLEALTYLQTHASPGLILLDLSMPVMDGWEFLRRKAADPVLAAIPVAVMSGADELEPEPVPPGASCHLGKPVDFLSLLGTVARFCAPACPLGPAAASA